MARVKVRLEFVVGEVGRRLSPVVGADGNPLFMERVLMRTQPDDDRIGDGVIGSIELRFSNPNLVGSFDPGDLFYMDLAPTPAEEDE